MIRSKLAKGRAFRSDSEECPSACAVQCRAPLSRSVGHSTPWKDRYQPHQLSGWNRPCGSTENLRHVEHWRGI